MNKKNRPTDDEPVILPFRALEHRDPPEPDPEPDIPPEESDPNKDEYWAGYIFAMRRSARVAA